MVLYKNYVKSQLKSNSQRFTLLFVTTGIISIFIHFQRSNIKFRTKYIQPRLRLVPGLKKKHQKGLLTRILEFSSEADCYPSLLFQKLHNGKPRSMRHTNSNYYSAAGSSEGSI